MPCELIAQLRAIVAGEGYSALKPVFDATREGADHVEIDEAEARNLLRLADIEMSKALLKFPHSEQDDPLYDAEHDEQYNDVMMVSTRRPTLAPSQFCWFQSGVSL